MTKITNFSPAGIPVALDSWSTGVMSINSNATTADGGLTAANFVQRITANSSNVLLNPIVNFASGSNILLTVDAGPANSVPSNTIRIHSTGGGGSATISAGSNSMRVSEISGPGASSTLWSPFDHQHDGIGTITASSSNTLQRGTFNLRPGIGIALSLTDTDGDGEFDTATIVNTGVPGPAGSGGGGTGNLTAPSAVSVDLGASTLLTRRAVVNAEDDLFDASSLDAKWLTFTGFDLVCDLTALPGWAKVTTAGAKLQAIPAGDWTIETEVIVGGTTGNVFQDSGLIVTNGTARASCTEMHLGIGQNNGPSNMRVVHEKFVNGAFSSTYGSQNGIGAFGDHIFLKIVKSGTNYQAFWSTTGLTWQYIDAPAGAGFTPTHFGFSGGDVGSYFNGFYRY